MVGKKLIMTWHIILDVKLSVPSAPEARYSPAAGKRVSQLHYICAETEGDLTCLCCMYRAESQGQDRRSEMGVPEGENRRTLTAELWAVVLGTRPVLKVAVGSLPSDATSQICDPETSHGTKTPKWGGGAKSRISERKSNGGGGEEKRGAGGNQP